MDAAKKLITYSYYFNNTQHVHGSNITNIYAMALDGVLLA